MYERGQMLFLLGRRPRLSWPFQGTRNSWVTKAELSAKPLTLQKPRVCGTETKQLKVTESSDKSRFWTLLSADS